MQRHRPRPVAVPTVLGVVILLSLSWAGPGLVGQVTENPRDPFGIALVYPFVHLVHSPDSSAAGGTAHLRNHHPFLLYQLGRDLVQRQFRLSEGVYGRVGALDVDLYVVPSRRLETARFGRDHAASCGMCHSSVYREPAAGLTLASTGGAGRNTPHFYGAGLMEMIGQRIQRGAMAACDGNSDGRIDRRELTVGCRIVLTPAPGLPAVDFGGLEAGNLAASGLDTGFRLWWMNAEGRPVPDAHSLESPGVESLAFAFQPFGWGRGRRWLGGHRVSQGGEATTLRELTALAADFHMGLQAHDPVQQAAHGGDEGVGGWGGVSLGGARQVDFGGSPDRGRRRTAGGLSLDDPDGDGHYNELTAGDLDAMEHYQLHAPAPAILATPESIDTGRRLLKQVGCTRCHVESWRIEVDRRLFRLETHTEASADGELQLVGTLVRSHRRTADGGYQPAGQPYQVDGIYTDFRHWDLGPAFHEVRFDGTVQRLHRTAPLWGVGSTAPYGHDGSHPSLHAVITAHAGAASFEAEAYRRLEPEERRRLLGYLKTLVLYPTDEIPVDLDGDGRRSTGFRVGSREVGYERFDARFLFDPQVRYRPVGEIVDPDGRTVPLLVIINTERAFGSYLELRLDTDQDGFPDRLDPHPFHPGLIREGSP